MGDGVPLETFHPAVARWLATRFGAPTPAQAAAWTAIAAGRHLLLAAPTGSGKTLAAFLSAIDGLVRDAERGPLPDATRVVYVSPLKALSNDIRLNLEEPLRGIAAELRAAGLSPHGIRSLVRTGDTPAAERAAMSRRPPHVLVTTPESLYLLLTSAGGRRVLATARTAIVDEIHAVAGSKRGAHLALSLERLAYLVAAHGGALQRIGLSATQRPVEELARFLVGSAEVDRGGHARCAIVDEGHRRELELGIEVPRSPLEAVMAGEVWEEVYDRLAELVRAHRTTLVFVGTRRRAERVTRHLGERLGEERVAAHHGSLSRDRRLDAEQRLKSGGLAALVATASLELGIDIGDVDLVCNVGSTRSIATLLQRVGRSGHTLRGRPRGRLFPTSRDELAECAALLDAVRRGELEELRVPLAPLDVLAQQVAAAVAAEEWREDELFEVVRRAWPYRALERERFDAVVRMIAEGFSTRRGRRGALVHRDAIHGRLRARRGTRLAALTSGGAIPDNANYPVLLEPEHVPVGTVDEDFAVESIAGDVFQLGNRAWRIRRIAEGRVLVEDARGAAPNVPFWRGEAPGRTDALSAAVARVRREVGTRLAGDGGEATAREWLEREVGVDPAAAAQLVHYLAAAAAALGALPTAAAPLLERFFDEAGNQHVVIHAPLGSRVNRAWGLALRKRFCRTFNFELQAAATDDAIVLSLGPTHSFPAADAFGMLHSATVRDVLTQATLDAPLFPVRWRWVAGTALAVPRFRNGRRVPPRLQRMQAEDLVAVVFPDQLACLENVAGDREIPDHPLVAQAIRDCLEEAMDVEGLVRLLEGLERGEVRPAVRELGEPSPLAQEVLGARPYAFLDDAPLEERRTQAVHARRWLDPRSAAEIGRLDAAAIERVRAEARPAPQGPDELHDALLVSGFLRADEAAGDWAAWFDSLVEDGRARRVLLPARGDELWIAAERVPWWRAALPAARIVPAQELPARAASAAPGADDALVEILRGRLEGVGPISAERLAASGGFSAEAVARALAVLEGQGFAMRGRFTPGAPLEEWCERGLLARIHRSTLDRLRREIEPVSPAHYLRFLAAWQHVAPDERLRGAASLDAVVEQLEGFEAPAASWEAEILPARVADYDPAWLDALCLAGRVVWSAALREGTGARPIRTTPVALWLRGGLGGPAGGPATDPGGAGGSSNAEAVRVVLARDGASFFDELVERTGLLRTQVEDALSELVARGEATSDGFSGLRALLTPSSRRPTLAGRPGRSKAVFGMAHAGRWSLARAASEEGRVDLRARSLLRRYGVVFRRGIDRERALPPWRELLGAFRRLEARGEIRGGRFVDGFSGEQFALPEAVGRLRAARRERARGVEWSISAADPLYLTGLVGQAAQVPVVAANRVLLRDGVPIAVLEAGAERFLVDLEPAARWEARSRLQRAPSVPALRRYQG